MFNTRISPALALLVLLALANAIPNAQQKASKDVDDFWAKKPMHTTNLMAGKAHKTIEPAATHIRIPTAIPIAPTQSEEVSEL
ncbi:hypothetical protein BU25DRAFT_405337 [Macroventuria anomochaeta]|uniref:Uncharacterized protein n=1 Tax=Macroventuria anomochaeta TaxID=301207 RepID=A0ACB6SGZ2_9PLEO|nr:uncharacterized protein BU25DRAFT_405337 [Macroventuria anomochaeta]KAF2633446.1 hypothetical protein BU25DRAFT_405337 [Macroventuria anomochaeta]